MINYNDIDEVLRHAQKALPKGTNIDRLRRENPAPFKNDRAKGSLGQWGEWYLAGNTPNSKTERDIPCADIKFCGVPHTGNPNRIRMNVQGRTDFLSKSWRQSGARKKLPYLIIFYDAQTKEIICIRKFVPSDEQMKEMQEDYEMYKSLAEPGNFWGNWHSKGKRLYKCIRLGTSGEGSSKTNYLPPKSWWMGASLVKSIFHSPAYA
tara:strand:+ start:82028 stop:82648 length:621 start_codon:yes stop_codon:yes gene_type:complete